LILVPSDFILFVGLLSTIMNFPLDSLLIYVCCSISGT